MCYRRCVTVLMNDGVCEKEMPLKRFAYTDPERKQSNYKAEDDEEEEKRI